MNRTTVSEPRPVVGRRAFARFGGGLGLLFLAGGLTGYIAGHLSRGRIDWHIPVAAVALVATVGLIAWLVRRGTISVTLTASGKETAYDRRIGRLGIVQLVAVVGLFAALSALFGLESWVGIAAGKPLAPAAALVFTLTMLAMVGWMFWSAHRAFDDLDQQAMLIGNTLGYYLVLALLPAWWVLSLGGWVPVPGAGDVGLVLLGAAMLSSLVWAWIKYRG